MNKTKIIFCNKGSSEDVTEIFEDSNGELLTEFDNSFEEVISDHHEDFYEPLEEVYGHFVNESFILLGLRFICLITF